MHTYTCAHILHLRILTQRPHAQGNTSGMAYGPRDRGDLRPLYKELAQKYRVVIYSGDGMPPQPPAIPLRTSARMQV